MIKNEKQMRITEEKLDGMRAQLARLRKQHSRDFDYQFYSETTQRHVDQMQRELDYFRLAKSSDVDGLISMWNEHGRFRPESKYDLTLGDFICLLRIARGLTQEQLAKRLSIEQAHVARYERNDYSGYSVETLDQILDALGVRLTLGKGMLPKAA